MTFSKYYITRRPGRGGFWNTLWWFLFPPFFFFGGGGVCFFVSKVLSLIIHSLLAQHSTPLFITCPKHSYSRDWLWNLASFKGQNKGAAIYVERSTTVHNLLFYVHTLWLNNLTVTFLLVHCSCKIQTYCCLCTVKAKNGNKNMKQKTLLSFITRFFY